MRLLNRILDFIQSSHVIVNLAIGATGLAFTIFMPLINWSGEKDQKNRLVLELKECDANLSTQNLSNCTYCEKILLTYKNSFPKNNCEGDITCENITKKIDNCIFLKNSSSDIGIQDIIQAHATAESSSLHNDIIKFIKLFEASNEFERCIIKEKYPKVEPYYNKMTDQFKQYATWLADSSMAIKNKDKQLAQQLLKLSQSLVMLPVVHDPRYPQDILNELSALTNTSKPYSDNKPEPALPSIPKISQNSPNKNSSSEHETVRKTSLFMRYDTPSDHLFQLFLSSLRSALQDNDFTLDTDIERSDFQIKLTKPHAQITSLGPNQDGLKCIASLIVDITGQRCSQKELPLEGKGEGTDEKRAIHNALKDLATSIASNVRTFVTNAHFQNKEIQQ